MWSIAGGDLALAALVAAVALDDDLVVFATAVLWTEGVGCRCQIRQGHRLRQPRQQ
jgi:hypothetical protein